jgi:hypothetical protein
MGSTHLAPGTQGPLARGPIKPHDEHANIDALREENAQLRELVIHLSKLVIKKVVDQK